MAQYFPDVLNTTLAKLSCNKGIDLCYITEKDVIDIFSQNTAGITINMKNELGPDGGDFETGYAGWTLQSPDKRVLQGYNGGYALSKTVAIEACYRDLIIPNGTSLYICAYIKSDSGAYLKGCDYGGFLNDVVSTPNANAVYTFHSVVKVAANGGIRIDLTAPDGNSYIDKVHAFNLLSAFGSIDKIPSKTALDAHMPYLIAKYGGYINEQNMLDIWNSYLKKTTKAPKARICNILTNGNFKFGTVGWIGLSSALSFSSSDNSMKVTALSNEASGVLQQTTNLITTSTTKRIYIKYSAMSIGIIPSGNISMYIAGTSGAIYPAGLSIPTENTWYSKSQIVNINTVLPGYIKFGYYCNSGIGKIFKIKDITIVDMGNDASNPNYNKTLTEMENMVGNYVNAYGFEQGEIDGEALLTYCGNGSGFVSKWYDQSGKGNDAIQTTAVYQPGIISSGVIESGLKWDNSDDRLQVITNTSINNISQISSFAKINLASAGGGGLSRIFDKGGVKLWYIPTGNSLLFTQFFTAGSHFAMAQNAILWNSQRNIAIAYDNSALENIAKQSINGAQLAYAGTPTYGTQLPATSDSSEDLYIGNISAGTRSLDGFISELIIWPRLLTQSQVNLLNKL